MIKRFFRRVTRLSLWGALVGAVVYFFDPRRGRGRRSRAKDQVQAKLRRTTEQAGQAASHVENRVTGLTHEADPSDAEPPDDDKTLVDKIKSEVLGPSEIATQDVVVDAAGGVVTLRGQVERPEQIEDLATAVGAVLGVQRVENHLHLPASPAPDERSAPEG